jgi:hypothetical protein
MFIPRPIPRPVWSGGVSMDQAYAGFAPATEGRGPWRGLLPCEGCAYRRFPRAECGPKYGRADVIMWRG